LLGYLKPFMFYLRDLARQHRYATAAQQWLSSLLRRTCAGQLQLSMGEARRYLPFLNRYREVINGRHQFVPIAVCRGVSDIAKCPALAYYEDRT
jgi:hypothetical protein